MPKDYLKLLEIKGFDGLIYYWGMENERPSKQLDIHDIRINRILRWTGWGLVIGSPIFMLLPVIFPDPEPSWVRTAILSPPALVWIGSMFFYPFFLIYRGLKKWFKRLDEIRLDSIPPTKVGPRGGVYTEEVTKDGKPYRNYF